MERKEREKGIREARKEARNLEVAIERMARAARAMAETTVMTKQYSQQGWANQGPETFLCSECQSVCSDAEWKFCAFCGREIVRFERIPEREPKSIAVDVADAKQEPKKVRVVFERD